MKKRKILLIGGGGHCRSVLDCLWQSGAYEEMGLIEQALYQGEEALGIPVVGTDADLPALFAAGWKDAAVTVGSVGRPEARRRLCQRLKEIGFTLPPVISADAVVGRGVRVAEGAFIGKRAVVNAGCCVGLCAIVNTGAIAEHDCGIGNFAHVSPGAVLCGGVQVGENSHVGAGAVVRQQIRIGRDAVIGAGSVIIRDVPDRCTVVGNPGRILEK
ncbi:acetyltransferase [Oscillibacter sp.]|uniref:acetyltransferase n=1 Tax=Oscillibacter sp. TaxID=1945593 RepID=UPI002D7E3F49|nr:acetyltransferase [Oscillibacter sp.]